MSDFSPAKFWMQIFFRNCSLQVNWEGEVGIGGDPQSSVTRMQRAAGMNKFCQYKRPYSLGKNGLHFCRGDLCQNLTGFSLQLALLKEKVQKAWCS